MRGEKKKKVIVKKKQVNKYNSDSSDNEGEDERYPNTKLSAKEMHELDIEGNRRARDSSDDDNELLLAEEEEDYENSSSKKKESGSAIEENVEAKEGQKSLKLGSVISKILATKADEKRPVLSLKRKIEEEIDDAKLEAKAKKQLTAEKKEKKDIGKVIPTHKTTDYEKSLRKIATRGVVQLFNALRAAQKTAEELEADGIQKNVSNVPVVSKHTFLKVLKNEEAIRKPVTVESNAEKTVPFLKDDFAMASTKKAQRWDEEDE